MNDYHNTQDYFNPKITASAKNQTGGQEEKSAWMNRPGKNAKPNSSGWIGVLLGTLGLVPLFCDMVGFDTNGILVPFLPTILTTLKIVAPFVIFAGGVMLGWALHRWHGENERLERDAQAERECLVAETTARIAREDKEHEEKMRQERETIETEKAEREKREQAEMREDARNIDCFRSITDVRLKAFAKVLVTELNNYTPVRAYFWHQVEESEHWSGCSRDIFSGDVRGTDKVVLSAEDWVCDVIEKHPELISDLSARDVDNARANLVEHGEEITNEEELYDFFGY